MRTDDPTRHNRMGPPSLGTYWIGHDLFRIVCPLTRQWVRSSRRAVGLLHDREADAGLVAALFRYFAPAVFGFLAGLERAFDLSRAFHELVEVHRAELAANHPEIAACGHDRLLLLAELVHRVVGA